MSDDTYFELPAHAVFGPQGVHVAALIERARHITPGEVSALDAARYDALDDAWAAAWGAAWTSALDTELGDELDGPWDIAWDAMTAAWATAGDYALAAALDATCALVVRDLIPTDHYDTITRPWREVIGPIHPDDPEITTTKE